MLHFSNILYPINLDSKNQNNVSKALEFAIANKSRIHFFMSTMKLQDTGILRTTRTPWR
jgi:hypothetical protein